MQNVLNCFRVLEEVAARQPIGVGELARVLDMPKSTVQRALTTLSAAGWIRPAGGELTRWKMTTKVMQLNHHAAELSLRDAAMPVMEELRERTEETIHLMVPDGNKIVLIERLQTRKPLRIVLPLGISLPMHASANGKAVLAALSDDDVDRILGPTLPTYTESTITDRKGLLAELEHVRDCGYATNSGEWRSDIAAVAAAIKGLEQEPIASISISTPSSRMPEEIRSHYGSLVREEAGQLSTALQHGRLPG